MKAKTELLLYRLLWLAEKPLRPTYFNLEQSFEGWAYRNGLLNQIHQLEAQGFLEATQDPASGNRLHRLTEAGRAVVLGGRDPETAWAMPWDRKWRLFLFDIPELESTKRRQLNRALAKAGCGCLQGSVWISPVTPPAIEKLIASDDPDCTHLLLLLADSKGPKADAKMAESAWDFETIHVAYQKLQETLDRFPQVARNKSRGSLAEWTASENAASRGVLRIDPLLPSELLPKKYTGRKVWKNRRKILAEAALLASSLTD
ncbi:MAG: PaaX family transcriptional regulator C-terminal domain-containing protein [Akkermansiaceae bacterium]